MTQSNDLVPATTFPSLLQNFNSFTDMMAEEDRSVRMFKGHVEVPQTKGNRHLREDGLSTRAGYFYIGGSDVTEGKYVKKFQFLLVAPFQLSVDYRPYRVGRRQHRKYVQDDAGAWKRDLDTYEPVCSSVNGVFPEQQFIGTTVIDIRNNVPVRIGFNRDNTPISETLNVSSMDIPAICKNCPLGNWIQLPDGRRKPPPCKPNTSFAIWILPHPDDYELAPDEDRLTVDDMGLYYISGSNGGIEDALQGVKAGKMSANINGDAFLGIKHYFSPINDKVELVVKTDDLTPEQHRFFAGYKKTKSAKEMSLTERQDWAVLMVPKLKNAPEGFPTDVGRTDVPLFAVETHIARNGFKRGNEPNPTLVPDFTLVDDAPVPSEFVDAYLETYKTFTSPEVISKYLGLDTVQDVVKKLGNHDIKVLNPADANPDVIDHEDDDDLEL